MRTRRARLRLELLESREVPASPAAAPSLGPPPPASANVLWVSTASQLQNALQNLQSNQTVVVQPGTYQITAPLYVGLSHQVSNVTIRGSTDNYSDVVIRGAGMDNSQVAYGFGIYNAQDVTIANLSIGAVYYDAVDLKGDAGAARVHLYHDRLFDTGEQLIKSNPGSGVGADNCTVEYCLIEYTTGPSTVDHGGGTGYTNGISAHTVNGWQVRHNLFRNFHTPDTSTNQWNPVILMWNHSQNTVVEGNTFIDCDRAVAFGLIDQASGFDHLGGVIRNNFVYQRPGLFSPSRKAASDGQIVVYDSPGTQVYYNTVVTSGNSAFSIEVRWANSGVIFSNNLADAPFHARDGGTFTGSGNYFGATTAMFVNAASADLHIVDNTATRANVINRAAALSAVVNDFDLQARPGGDAADVGADELAAPPRVKSVVVNDGTAQRSRVTTLTVTFSASVTFGGGGAAAGAFTLARDSDSAAVAFSAAVSAIGGVTVVTLTNFTGPATQFGSLADGRFTLTALASQIAASGQSLDGNGDGTAGDNYTFGNAQGLYRLFGDANGDRVVNASDLSLFRAAYGSTTTDLTFDVNGDGVVNATDLSEFRTRYGATVT